LKQFIHSKAGIDEGFAYLSNRAKSFWNWEQHPVMEIEIRPSKSRRSLDQNALFWKWMEELSGYFTKHGRPLTKDDAHDLMCHKFLGYVTKVIGETTIVKPVTTSKLPVGDFTMFLEEIDAWAVDKGCMLPTPADSAHAEHMKSQKA
jgi:hypothetical protein